MAAHYGFDRYNRTFVNRAEVILKNNIDFVTGSVEEPAGLEEALRHLLYDPQTSGGLLIAVAAAQANALLAAIPGGRRIGCAVPRGERPIRIL